METLRLPYPVYTLDRGMRLAPGTKLSRELMDDMIASEPSDGAASIPLLEFGTIEQDMLDALRYGPYPSIFRDPQTIGGVLSIAGDVLLPVSVLRYFDYFREAAPYTYSHILKVVAMTALLSRTLMKYRRDWVDQARAAAVHDLGKVCVPIETLKKRDPLTRAERSVLEHHTLAGYVLLGYHLREPDGFPAKVALNHHERKDASDNCLGAPLSGLDVEIVTACDVYDALISPRPYREEAYDNRTALEEIVHMAERGKLAWKVVKALVAWNRKNKPDYSRCVVSRERRGIPPKRSYYGVTVDDGS